MLKIEIEYPYSEDWDKAVLRLCEDGRRRVTLWRKRDGKLERMGTAYARYLMAVHLGRYLTDDEHVDHKDEDRANDHIDNLQILTPAQNALKNYEYRMKQRDDAGNPVMVILECACCGVSFTRAIRKVRAALEQGKPITCSKLCRSKFHSPKGKRPPGAGKNRKVISDSDHAQTVELRVAGKSDYEISALLNISRPKVFRYRKEKGIA